MSASRSPSRFVVMADDDHAVANAGLVLTAIVAERLGIEALADELVDLGDRAGGSRPGRKILSLAQAIVADGDCIDDVEMLRAGATGQVLGHKAMAASTCGTFLRSFTFGHIRQLDQLSAEILGRAWAAGAGPGDAPMTMDLDSTVCEVHGDAKQGAAYGYTRVLGLHPLMATRGYRRGVARPPAQRVGQHRARRRAVRERARRAGPSGRSERPVDVARRFRVSLGEGDRRVPPPPHRLLHHGQSDQRGPRRHRRDRRGHLGGHRLHRGRPGRGRRDHLQRRPAHRAPHPTGRPPSPPVARMAPSRVRHRPRRHPCRPRRRSPQPRRRRARHPSTSKKAPGGTTRRPSSSHA